MTKTLIVVTTAPWATERERMTRNLVQSLRIEAREFGICVYDHKGTDRTSHVPNYTAAIRQAIVMALHEGDVTHITLLPDDAILVPHFVEVLTRLIEQRPDDHLCLLSNHPAAKAAFDAGAVGYTTAFGSVLMGGTLRVQEWADYLAWRDDVLSAAVPFDNGVNLWLATKGRKTFKPLPSLCEHDTTLESMLGNQAQENDPARRYLRHSAVFSEVHDLRNVDWRGAWDGEGMGHMVGDIGIPDLGPTFPNQCWDLVLKTRPATWDIDAMYTANRGAPVDAKHVMLSTPAYAGTVLAMEQSRSLVERDLHAHGITVTRFTSSGDSLVTRGRHSLMHEFLLSPCSHMLMWDADIEAMRPDVVRKMLETGHDVIGGAYPFRDGSGRVVCNPLRTPTPDGKAETIDIDIQADGSIPVREIGTGFLLVSRRAILKLCALHPEMLYVSDLFDTRGAPMWALFDAKIVKRRYLSEDYFFCMLWREAGETVYAYGPAELRHWGALPSEGCIATAWAQWGVRTRPVAEAAE